MPSHAKVVKREQWEEGEKGGEGGRDGVWKGGCGQREREELVRHGGWEHVGDEGRRGVWRALGGGLDACKINILWTLLLDEIGTCLFG